MGFEGGVGDPDLIDASLGMRAHRIVSLNRDDLWVKRFGALRSPFVFFGVGFANNRSGECRQISCYPFSYPHVEVVGE